MSVQVEDKVKGFNHEKGLGFTEQEDGNDVFLHYRAANSTGHKTLKEGQRVSSFRAVITPLNAAQRHS